MRIFSSCLLIALLLSVSSAWATKITKIHIVAYPAGQASEPPPDTAPWREHPLSEPLHPGISDSIYWMRAQLDSGASDGPYDLVVSNCLPDTLDAFQKVGPSLRHYQGGDRRPFTVRKIPTRHFSIPLHSSDPVYVRMASHDGLHEPITLHTARKSDLSRFFLRDTLFYGAYFGALLFAFALTFLYGILFRERLQLLFAGYTFSFCIWSLTFHGFSDPLLWPSWPISNQVMMGSVCIFSSLQALFGIYFLRLPSTHPRLARTLWVFVVVVLLFLPPLAFLDAYRWFFTLYILAMLPAVGLLLTSGILVARAGELRGWIFVASWSVLLVGGALYMLKAMGVVASSPLTEQAFFIGNLVQILVLGLALNLRQHQAQMLANLTLERLVASRTDELKQANRELKRLSQRDPLTGLFNRRHFEELFHQHASLHRRKQISLSILMIDIDFFKQFNDTYGHVAGDQCLRQVAAQLQSSLARASDFCARFGGEEFIICLGGTEPDGCLRVAERLRKAIVDLGIPHSASKIATHVTISIGCATSPGEAPLDLHALKERADRALYHAKKLGRNQVAQWQPPPFANFTS